MHSSGAVVTRLSGQIFTWVQRAQIDLHVDHPEVGRLAALTAAMNAVHVEIQDVLVALTCSSKRESPFVASLGHHNGPMHEHTFEVNSPSAGIALCCSPTPPGVGGWSACLEIPFEAASQAELCESRKLSGRSQTLDSLTGRWYVSQGVDCQRKPEKRGR